MIARIACGLGLIALLAGCATGGATRDEIRTALGPPAAGHGRIYLYRTSPRGFAIQPEIRVNDVPVGRSVPNGFFFVDRPAGVYIVATTTEVTRAVRIELAAGETRYVRTDISFGILAGRVTPVLVSREEAEVQLVGLSYTGDPVPPRTAGDRPAAAPEAAAPSAPDKPVDLDDLKGLLPPK
ncbi:MAG TPA: DUF2846 domain-containing protein [Burkholderiales bacterium]|nr:DUF2846 domain-containing protein [Burkholderiales bacterium]